MMDLSHSKLKNHISQISKSKLCDFKIHRFQECSCDSSEISIKLCDSSSGSRRSMAMVVHCCKRFSNTSWQGNSASRQGPRRSRWSKPLTSIRSQHLRNLRLGTVAQLPRKLPAATCGRSTWPWVKPLSIKFTWL